MLLPVRGVVELLDPLAVVLVGGFGELLLAPGVHRVGGVEDAEPAAVVGVLVEDDRPVGDLGTQRGLLRPCRGNGLLQVLELGLRLLTFDYGLVVPTLRVSGVRPGVRQPVADSCGAGSLLG